MDSNVSDDERRVALEFCNKYLTGAWRYVTLDQLTVNAVSGGMTNLLYRCTINEDIKLSQEEPRQVLLRIYGPSSCNIPVQVSIFSQLAKARLGPNLYCTFDEGRFEEYLPSNPLTNSQFTDSAISKVVVEKIAAIHRLSVHELAKKSSWLIDNYHELNGFVELAKKNGVSLEFSLDTLESTRKIAHQMMAIDFKHEIDYLSALFKRLNVPLVFSHNDIHQNNVILLHDTDQSLRDRVVLIDFEYCSYNYLTFDLANYLSEWCFDYTGDDYPNFNFSLDRFPSTEEQRRILTHYVTNLEHKFKQHLFGSSLSDSYIVELLLVDLQPMFMASNMLWCIWAIRSVLTSKIKFGYWEMAKSKWDVYASCKRKFQDSSDMDLSKNNKLSAIKLQSSKM